MDLGVETLIGRKDGPIGWLIFNNPARRNAVSLEMWRAIPDVLGAFEADPEVRVVVFTGVGPGEEASPELLMMVLVGGRGRRLDEFRQMGREAGLEMRAVGRQPSGRHIAEFHPA